MGVQVQASGTEAPVGASGDVPAEMRGQEAGPAIAPQISPARIRQLIKARRAREQLFGPDLFADPAWDMLLESYIADLRQARLTVTDLCQAAAVPATTALRWIQKLEQEGWLTRRKDPLDARRTWVELTPRGSARMAQYFGTILPDALPV